MHCKYREIIGASHLSETFGAPLWQGELVAFLIHVNEIQMVKTKARSIYTPGNVPKEAWA